MLRFSQAIVAGVMASTFLFACGDKINPKGDQPTDSAVAGSTGFDGGGGGTDGPVTYTQAIKPILDKYCTGCHSPALAIPPALDTYNDAKANASAAHDAIEAGTMPPSGKAPTAAETQALQDWITQGTPQ